MSTDAARIRFNRKNDLVIPANLARRVGLTPESEPELRVLRNGLDIILRIVRSDPVQNRLDELIGAGVIELTEFEFNAEEQAHVPRLEELHESLAGVSIPLEEMIRKERDKRDDILHH